MFEFTKKSKKILEVASQNEGRRLNSEVLVPDHIFISLLKDEDSVAARIMKNLGINFEKTIFLIEKNLRTESNTLTLGKIPVSESFKRVIEFSREEAKDLKNSYIGTEHLLLAIFKEGNCFASIDLDKRGISYQSVKAEILRVLGVKSTSKTIIAKKNEKISLIEDFTVDLTALATEGLLDPVIGRDIEIARVVRILSRKRKNNPILIGEAGVGKTAIVEGLAQRIIAGDVPDTLVKSRVLSLDLSAIVAGTKYRGEFEERLKRLVNEVAKKDGLIIFIDEIHTLTGAGAAEGAIDASNILKPALARGELQCIGATTFGEFRLYIEKDGALVRRFQNILVDEPDADEVIEILNGLKSSYESYHKVKFTEKAIEAAVFLSDRYIPDRFFPDKAIDIIDEAGAMARYDNTDKPDEIEELENEIKILNENKVELVQGQEYEQAARVRDLIAEKKEKLARLNDEWSNRANKYEIIVEAELIARVVSEMSGVPVEEITDDESEKLLKMEDYLHRRIIGQDEAVETVSRAIRRSRIGLSDGEGPIGSFIFIGPTGVGKTELVKALAEFLFDDEKSIIRLDMSEFMEKHSISRLVGSPPGYVGYEDGGQLTEKVKRKPYSIILFDEIEKAHPDIFNILLQILDEGELTDSSGVTVSFRDTVVILTSNIGTNTSIDNKSLGFGKTEEFFLDKKRIKEQLNKIFSLELLNRIDEVVFFNKLKKIDIFKITDLLLLDLSNRLNHNGMKIEFTASVKKFIVEEGFDGKSGARNIKRIIRKKVEDELATRLLKDKCLWGSRLRAVMKGGKVYFKIVANEVEYSDIDYKNHRKTLNV